MQQPPLHGPQVDRPAHWVIAAGLATTAVALYGVHWLNTHTDDFNVMGWYVNYVIPLGALLVGLVAGSGYGMASWVTSVKISRRLLWLMLALQVTAYFAALYVEYRQLDLYEGGRRVGFLEYVDRSARQFAWKQRDGRPGTPLGAWGYAFRLLELGGFVAGGLVIPLILKGHPYCEACQLYLRRKALGLLPGGVAPRKIKKADALGRAAYESEQADAAAQGQVVLDELVGNATAGRASEFTRLLEAHAGRQKEYRTLHRRIELTLATCRGCRTGYLEATALQGYGDKVQKTRLGRWDVAAGFVADFLRA
jgi:hypothetical protein